MWLALDSSTMHLSLALAERQGEGWLVRSEAAPGPPQKHSEMLPRALEALLAQAGVEARALEGLVVGLGPGSFTGLRVGLASAKALAYAYRLPLTGVSSLAALAFEPGSGFAAPGAEAPLLRPCTLSRRGELYVGAYRRTPRGVLEKAPEVALGFESTAAALRDDPDAVLFGPPIAEHRAALEALGAPSRQLRDGPAHPAARALLALATLPAGYDFAHLSALEPHYIGTSGAERNAPRPVRTPS